MELMTVEEMIESLDFFNGRSKSSVMSFLRSRKITHVMRGKKRVKGLGSAPFLYDANQVVKRWAERPIGAIEKTSSGAGKRVYAKKEDNEAPILGKKQPFRAIDDCINYYACLDESAKKGKSLKCFRCERYQKKEFNYYG